MDMMQITGEILIITDRVEIKPDFDKREIILLTDETYPQTLCIELIKDRCDLADLVKVGENVTIFMSIRGRQWENPQGEIKYFTSLSGWKIRTEQPQNDTPENVPVTTPLADDKVDFTTDDELF